MENIVKKYKRSMYLYVMFFIETDINHFHSNKSS